MEKGLILHCIPNMAGGGAERQLVYLAGELVKRNWRVHVALTKEGPNYAGLAATGSIIHKIPCRGSHDITILVKLITLIRRINPHLVQTWLRQMDILGGIAAGITGTPFLLSERNSAPAYPPSIKHLLRVFIGRYAASIVSNSSGGRQYWQTKIGNASRMDVINNAVPLEEIEKCEPSACSLPADSKVLLSAGRFHPSKNIDAIISAFKIVSSRRDAVLILCGDGELRPLIEERVRKENLQSRVLFPGYVQNLWGLMKRADLFISVSSYEGHPNVILEAMSCCCPLILSDIPAHRDILQEGQAFFVDQGNPSDIARAILSCMEDPETAKKMALSAQSHVHSHSISAVADQYERIYCSVLSTKGT